MMRLITLAVVLISTTCTYAQEKKERYKDDCCSKKKYSYEG